MDFVETAQYTKEDVKAVQNRLMEMAKSTIDILERHGFHYMIAFGTLLGAVRHGGFIPWDDDLDFFLFDEEYDAAIDCLRQELPQDIIVHDRLTDPIYWPAWSRLRDLNSKTTAIKFPDDNAYKYTGINLDLYRIKRVKKCDAEEYRRKEYLKFLIRKHDAGLIEKEKFEELFEKGIEDCYMASANKESDTGKEVFAFVLAFKEVAVDDILPLKKVKFEDCEFWAPNNTDACLTHMYGDYMQIPEFSKRKPHYDRIEFLKK